MESPDESNVIYLWLSNLSLHKLVIVIILTILFFTFIIDSLSTHYTYTYTSDLIKQLDQLNVFLMTFLFFIISIIAILLCFPTGILFLSCGYLYAAKIGFTWGVVVATIANIIENTCAACLSFYISKYIASTEDERILSQDDFHPILWGIRKALEDQGFTINLLLRLAPIVPSALSNYSMYLLGSSLNDFLLGAFIGTIPYAVLLSICGAMLNDTSQIVSFMENTPLWITIPVLIVAVVTFIFGTYFKIICRCIIIIFLHRDYL